MVDKEICLDLSKVIKFSESVYISLGTLILSAIIAIIQLLTILSMNGWIWTSGCFTVFLNFILSIRGKYPEDKIIPDDEKKEDDE